MCSNVGPLESPAGGDLAARLGKAIDELASQIDDDVTGADLAERLAAAWAMIAAADPEVAARTARYSH
jgi:hypothetical protein